MLLFCALPAHPPGKLCLRMGTPTQPMKAPPTLGLTCCACVQAWSLPIGWLGQQFTFVAKRPRQRGTVSWWTSAKKGL